LHLIGCLTTDAFGLETIVARPIFDGDQIRDLEVERKNRAKEIVREFTIATNDVTSRYLAAEKLSSIQLVVSAPKRWDRIVTLAQEHASCRLARIRWRLMCFSSKRKPLLRFPDPSLAMIKLLRAGEYISERPDDTAPGHLGLAAKDYAYSTAPKRRYTSLITQRLLKAAIASR
jgi:exoribonuclease R